MSYIKSQAAAIVDSHRPVSGTDADFLFQITLPPGHNFDRVCVTQLNLPKSMYLVSATNNTFTLTEGAQSVSIVMDQGNYSVTSFAAVLTAKLNTASPNGITYTVTFPNTATAAQTGKYAFTCTNVGGIQPTFTFGTQLNEQLGFEPSTSYPFVAFSLTSVNVVRMQPKTTLLLRSDVCENKGTDFTDVLQELFVSANPDFSAITYQCTDVQAYSKRLASRNSNVYRFYVTDEDGNAVNLNGLNTVFTLLFWEVDPIYAYQTDVLRAKVARKLGSE